VTATDGRGATGGAVVNVDGVLDLTAPMRSDDLNEVEGIKGAGPQNFILGGWLPQNQLTMVIIPPLPSPPFRFVPPIPIY
jgi:hypothetical protein